jgi:hypothetical protein
MPLWCRFWRGSRRKCCTNPPTNDRIDQPRSQINAFLCGVDHRHGAQWRATVQSSVLKGRAQCRNQTTSENVIWSVSASRQTVGNWRATFRTRICGWVSFECRRCGLAWRSKRAPIPRLALISTGLPNLPRVLGSARCGLLLFKLFEPAIASLYAKCALMWSPSQRTFTSYAGPLYCPEPPSRAVSGRRQTAL